MPGGVVDDGGSHVGAIRRISCQENYKLTGPDFVESCGELPTVANGQAETSSFSTGSMATVSCNNGYRLNGENNFITCLSSGQWTVPNAECLPETSSLTCGPLPVVSNGYFLPGNNVVGSLRIVRCNDSFTLRGIDKIYCMFGGQWTEPGICEIG